MNYRVTTSAGEALLRVPQGLSKDSHLDLPRQFPEVTALLLARGYGARVPEVLYAEDSFFIEEYLTGHQASFDGPDPLSWLPDLLQQLISVYSHHASDDLNQDVYQWQNWHLDFFTTLENRMPPEHRARLDSLHLPSLADFWRPDPAQRGRPLAFVHADLFPGNLLVTEAGTAQLDLEFAQYGDPIYDGAVFLHRSLYRTGFHDQQIVAQAEEMWLGMYRSIGLANVEPILRHYLAAERWTTLMWNAWRIPQLLIAAPSQLDELANALSRNLSFGAEHFDCLRLSAAGAGQLIREWMSDSDVRNT
jgi:aminoglycoside phosphotransferase (APT) family kinase protein